MVFQNYAIWPHMSVFDNIAFSLKLKKMSGGEIKKKVQATADMVKIGNLLGRLPGQLSGGQQQRVALARALAVEPKLFLMDEPLSNLDAKLRVIMRTELKAIHQQTHATSIFVTHDQSEAMSMADRIVIMKDGEIVQIGTPDEVYFKSANIFVAGFIGTPPSNFFTVKCTVVGSKISLRHSDFTLTVDSKEFEELKSYQNRDIVIGARPEDILIVPKEKAVFSEEVLVVEPQGSHQVVAFKLNETIVKMIVSPEVKVRPADTVGLAFNLKRLHFFDGETEKRIPLKREDF